MCECDKSESLSGGTKDTGGTFDTTPATDINKEVTVTSEVCKSNTLAAVTSDINRDLDGTIHFTLGNDDVVCVS